MPKEQQPELRYILVITIVLTLIAAVPRFYGLGALGFYGDEETTALPARALAEGHGPTMPTGMPYYRALPLTWTNALLAEHMGLDRELSYRLSSAVLGTLTIPLLFLLAGPFVGWRIAALASVLLALSEWHIAVSREARMYGPFLFFYLGTAFATWRWATTGKNFKLVIAGVSFAVAVSLHQLGMLAVVFALIPIVFASWTRVAPLRLLAVSLIGILGAGAYARYFVNAAFRSGLHAQREQLTAKIASAPVWLPLPLEQASVWGIGAALIGTGLGLWAAVRGEPADLEPGHTLRFAGRCAGAAATGALACIGQLYGASLALLVLLYLYPGDRLALARRVWLPATLVVALAGLWSAATLARLGIGAGVKMLLNFPFPYPSLLAEIFPIILLLFTAASVYLALRAPSGDEYPIRACVLAAILPLAAVGIASRWGGVRYLLGAYPFILITAAAALLWLLGLPGRLIPRWSQNHALVLAVLLAALGALTGHGMPQALGVTTLNYGDRINALIYNSVIYPDHRTPGLFLRRNLVASDIVVAEDPLEQRWYAGRADYWFRNPADARAFAYRAGDGHLRDVYVDSVLLETATDLETLVKSAAGRVWLVTSGETYFERDYYLSPEQRAWLASVEKQDKAAFVGLDGVTRVYCLNCSEK
jgi:4-amino-4-deoxy-L-arabinose transferase-like glycosyltransferase